MLDDGGNEITYDEKVDSTEILAQMVDKLHIDENSTSHDVSKLMQKAAIRKEITKPEHNFKRTAIPSYDIDRMPFQDLQVSLRRIKETPQEPFSFLANICEIFNGENQLAAKPTDIDIQLVSVAKRIESSRTLLEEAKSHIDKIHLRVKRDAVMPQQSSNTRQTHEYSVQDIVIKRMNTDTMQFHSLHRPK